MKIKLLLIFFSMCLFISCNEATKKEETNETSADKTFSGKDE